MLDAAAQAGHDRAAKLDRLRRRLDQQQAIFVRADPGARVGKRFVRDAKRALREIVDHSLQVVQATNGDQVPDMALQRFGQLEVRQMRTIDPRDRGNAALHGRAQLLVGRGARPGLEEARAHGDAIA